MGASLTFTCDRCKYTQEGKYPDADTPALRRFIVLQCVAGVASPFSYRMGGTRPAPIAETMWCAVCMDDVFGKGASWLDTKKTEVKMTSSSFEEMFRNFVIDVIQENQ